MKSAFIKALQHLTLMEIFSQGIIVMDLNNQSEIMPPAVTISVPI